MVTQPRWLRAVSIAAATTLFASVLATVPMAAQADTAPTDSATPATVSSDSLPTVQVNGVVWSQTIVGNTVFVGGDFTQAQPAGAAAGVSTVPRTDMLAYNLSTGALITSFAPTFDAQVRSVTASPDGSTVYAVGNFTKVNGVNRYRIVALDATTGAVKTGFAPQVNSAAYSVVATSDTVYVGGTFTVASNVARTRAAAFDAASGAIKAWAPSIPDHTVRAMVISPDRTKLVLGGSFSSLNGSTSPGQGLGAVDATTGASLPWNAGKLIYDHGDNASIFSLTSDGTNVYGTGYVFGGLADGNLEGAFNATWADGTINWIEDCHGDSYSVATLGDSVYTVSHDHYCGNVPGGFAQTDPSPSVAKKQYALAFSKNVAGTLAHDTYGSPYADFGGTPAPRLLTWYPDLTAGTYTGQNQAAWNVTAGNGYLLLGGEFQTVNNKRQTGLARFATSATAPNTDGPRLGGTTWTPTAVSLASGSMRVSWPSNWDRDNGTLTYTVTRNGGATPVYTGKAESEGFWLRPTLGFVDTGLTPGDTVSYRVKAADAFGNTAISSTVTATVSSGSGSSAYSNAVVADGASDYWRFGEAGGATSYDWAGYSDLTSGSGVALGAAGAINGDSNTAATFSGDSTGLAATASPIAGPSTFTVETWFQTTSTAGGKIVGFGNANTGTSSSYDRHVFMDGSGRVLFGVYPGFTATVQSNTGYNDGQWHYVVASLSSAGMQLFLDGKRVGARSDVTTAQAYSGYWRVGGDSSWSGANFFAGSIDDTAIYPTALAASTVKSHWVASGHGTTAAAPTDAYGAQVFADGPDSYWRLGDAAGTGTVADASGNGVSASANSGVTFGAAGGVRGTSDTAATFDGDGGLLVSNQASNDPEIYSLQLWFKTTTTRGGKLIGFGNATSGRSSSYDRHIWMLDNGQLEFGTYTGQLNTVTSGASFNDGAWHQVVASQGADGLKLYVDGALVGTNPQTQAQAYTGYWRLGGDTTWGGNSSDFFAGTLDDAAIYSSTLTAAQVSNDYQLGASKANVPPVAAFTATASDLAEAFDGTSSTDSDGTIAGYSWDFGDGATGTGSTPHHTYDAAGTFTVGLTVTDDKGATNTVTKQVTVAAANASPTASFTANASGLGVSVDGSASRDTDGTVASYAWAFGDGGSATGATATHTYTAAGTYSVRLTITDDRGGTDTATRSVTVVAPNSAPTAAFTATESGLKVSVDGSGSTDSDGTVAAYAWDFGDSGTDSGATATHTYSSAGTYTVTLTVTDNDGATSVSTKAVTVGAAANVAPKAAFSTSISGLKVSADASGSTDSDGSVASYSWDFGDGANGSGVTASHTYATGGVYTVTLTVKDDGGASDSLAKSVTVVDPAAAMLAKDAFNRTVSSGFGSADSGGTWTLSGTASDFSVAPGAATISTTAGQTRSAYLGAVQTSSADLSATLSIPAVQTGGTAYWGLVGRRIGSDDYNARVTVSAAGAVGLQILRGGSTLLKSASVPGLTYTAGTPLRFRLQAFGTNPTTLQVRVWKAADVEPTTWQATVTDSTAALQSAGSIGVRDYLGSGVTSGRTAFTYGAFAAQTVGAPAPNNAPVASFTSSASGLVGSFDATASSDSDGTVKSYAWDFGDGSTGTGATTSHTYAAAGTYTVGLTVTDDQGARDTSSKSLSVTAPATAHLATDAFGRTTASGLGTADTGGAWTVSGGAANFAVGSGTAKLSTAKGVTLSGYLSSVSAPSSDTAVSITVPTLPVGGSLYAGVVGRRIGSDDYAAYAIVSASGAVSVSVLHGGKGLNTAVVPGLTVTPGSVLHVRMLTTGSGGTTTLRARAWLDGSPQPSSWQANATDTTAAMQGSGSVGVRSYLASAATNGPIALRMDDFLADPAS